MSIEKKLEALTEAIVRLTVALEGQATATSPAPTVVKEKPPKKEKPKKTEPTVADEPVQSAEDTETPDAPSQSKMTMEDVREKLTPIVEQKGAGFIQSVLSRMGVKKLSEVDPGDYGKLFELVEEDNG